MRDMFEMLTNKVVILFLLTVFALTLTTITTLEPDYYVHDEINQSTIVYKK